MLVTRYLDPKNDYAFKRIFGEEKHKRIPISFLNAVFNLTGDQKIIDLTFLATNQTPKVAARKESIVDVLVEDQGGSRYIIEMQVAKIKGFEKRAQYYAAKTYCSHFNRGDDYSDLSKVVFLAITDYTVFPNKPGFKSDHVILDDKTFEHDLKDFYFTFVELPKFTKTFDELETLEDRWYYFLKHTNDTENLEKLILDHPEIEEAYDVLDRHNWNEGQLHMYERMTLAIMDEKNAILAAQEDGLEKGLKQGIEKGLKQGIEQGIEKGRDEKSLEIAKRLLASLSMQEVSEFTEIPIDTLRQLDP